MTILYNKDLQIILLYITLGLSTELFSIDRLLLEQSLLSLVEQLLNWARYLGLVRPTSNNGCVATKIFNI